MSVTSVNTSDTFDIWRQKDNEISTRIGDLDLLNTIDKSSFVAALNELKSDVASLIISLSLLNDTYLTARNNADNDDVNILKLNTSDTIEFGTEISEINITGGTITSLTSAIPITAGGTGAEDAITARSNLGLVIGSDVQSHSSDLDDIAGLSTSQNDFLVKGASNWENKTTSEVQSILSLVPGVNIQAYNGYLQNISGLTPSSNSIILYNGTNYVSNTPTQARTNLGLAIGSDILAYNSKVKDIGDIVPTNNNFLVGNGSTWVKKTESEIRSILSLVINSNVQAYSANLTTIASLSSSTGKILVGSGAGWTSVNGDSDTFRSTIGLAIGSDVQAYSQNLRDISNMSNSPSDGSFIVGDGSNFSLEDSDTARTSLSAAKSGTNTDITTLSGAHTIGYVNASYDVTIQAATTKAIRLFPNSYDTSYEFKRTYFAPSNNNETDIGQSNTNRFKDIYFGGVLKHGFSFEYDYDYYSHSDLYKLDESFTAWATFDLTTTKIYVGYVARCVNTLAKYMTQIGIINDTSVI